ncbi:MAG TPA: peptide chain release factor 2 [Dehalococcoidia bacterium]|nr:peptide chain release factor 2 [Dehalococcoidia bacterium]
MEDLRGNLLELAERISHIMCAFDVDSKAQEAAKLEEKASQPDLWQDPGVAQETMRRLAALKEQVELWRGLAGRARDLLELLELAMADSDTAMAQEVAAEAGDLARTTARREYLLLLSDEYDARDAILAVHAGAGGTDSMDWAQMLLRMYLRWAERRGFAAQFLDMTEGEEAGIKSATLEVRGPYSYGYLKGEKGVHRLVRLSPFDAGHARHTSFALVEVLPEVESPSEVAINPEELRTDVFRASGPGGQNVQKNATAVRITHLPSGISVSCQNERSLSRNKEAALKVLEARLLELELEKRAEEQARFKGEHVAAAWGNQIRSYVLHPYKLVKDHRTGQETSDAPAVLDGDIDPFLEAYLRFSLQARAEAQPAHEGT